MGLGYGIHSVSITSLSVSVSFLFSFFFVDPFLISDLDLERDLFSSGSYLFVSSSWCPGLFFSCFGLSGGTFISFFLCILFWVGSGYSSVGAVPVVLFSVAFVSCEDFISVGGCLFGVEIFTIFLNSWRRFFSSLIS